MFDHGRTCQHKKSRTMVESAFSLSFYYIIKLDIILQWKYGWLYSSRIQAGRPQPCTDDTLLWEDSLLPSLAFSGTPDSRQIQLTGPAPAAAGSCALGSALLHWHCRRHAVDSRSSKMFQKLLKKKSSYSQDWPSGESSFRGESSATKRLPTEPPPRSSTVL